MKPSNRIVSCLFALLFLGIITVSAHAERWTVTKVNGGGDGYLIVKSETNDPIIGETTHTLVCQNPGHEPCIWPDVSSSSNPVLIPYAEDRIHAGILTGEYSANVNGVNAHVTWSASDEFNAQIIEVQPDGIQ
jgi:hypothetical protein